MPREPQDAPRLKPCPQPYCQGSLSEMGGVVVCTRCGLAPHQKPERPA